MSLLETFSGLRCRERSPEGQSISDNNSILLCWNHIKVESESQNRLGQVKYFRRHSASKIIMTPRILETREITWHCLTLWLANDICTYFNFPVSHSISLLSLNLNLALSIFDSTWSFFKFYLRLRGKLIFTASQFVCPCPDALRSNFDENTTNSMILNRILHLLPFIAGVYAVCKFDADTSVTQFFVLPPWF